MGETATNKAKKRRRSRKKNKKRKMRLGSATESDSDATQEDPTMAGLGISARKFNHAILISVSVALAIGGTASVL